MGAKDRVQLTWWNKDPSHLNHGVSTYEWVDGQDWRVKEVRLLNAVEERPGCRGSGDATAAMYGRPFLPIPTRRRTP